MANAPKNAVFAAGWVARVLGLPEVPSILRHPGFTSVTTDSRNITPGCLFVAMQGEKQDGHAFISNATIGGAAGIVCKTGTPAPALPKAPATQKTPAPLIFEVADTRTAYRSLAESWRREFKIPVLAVAGSVGKTTTKELIAAILRGKWANVLKTEGSQNGFDGIPKTLLNLRPEHQVAVIEVGIDEIGAMEKHLKIVAPTASIVTAVGPEHLETLGTIEKVAIEEGLALSLVMKSGGTGVINLDDPYLAPHAQPGAKQICFTFKDPSSVPNTPNPAPTAMTVTGSFAQASGSKSGGDQKNISVVGLGLKNAVFPLPVSGRHNGRNLLGAIAVALSLGLKELEIRNGLKTFKGPTGRSELKSLPGPIQVICDYYNASPPSMAAGFQLLQDTHAETSTQPTRTKTLPKKWACLADMLELGKDEKLFHQNLALALLSHNIDNILLYGPRMKVLEAELLRLGYKGMLKHFAQQADLAKTLTSGLHAGDTVLIKGSRGMKMEEVWKILENYANSHSIS